MIGRLTEKWLLCHKLVIFNTDWNNIHALCSLTIEHLLYCVKADSGNLLFLQTLGHDH